MVERSYHNHGTILRNFHKNSIEKFPYKASFFRFKLFTFQKITSSKDVILYILPKIVRVQCLFK